jgi:hypothetical protein
MLPRAYFGEVTTRETAGQMVRPVGFEPTTCGLRVRCSAVELEARDVALCPLVSWWPPTRYQSLRRLLGGREPDARGARASEPFGMVRRDARNPRLVVPSGIRWPSNAPAETGRTLAPQHGQGPRPAQEPINGPAAGRRWRQPPRRPRDQNGPQPLEEAVVRLVSRVGLSALVHGPPIRS